MRHGVIPKHHKRSSFVVLGDDAVPHSRKQHEDNTTVQRVLAIRRRLPDVRVVAQLLLERNAHRLAREDVRVVCCDAFKYAMLGRSVEVPGLALLLTTLLAEAPGAEYAQNSHIGNTPELLQPENEFMKNHKVRDSAWFPDVSELQVASMASTRRRTAATPSP